MVVALVMAKFTNERNRGKIVGSTVQGFITSPQNSKVGGVGEHLLALPSINRVFTLRCFVVLR